MTDTHSELSGQAYRGLTGRFSFLRIFSVAVSVSHHGIKMKKKCHSDRLKINVNSSKIYVKQDIFMKFGTNINDYQTMCRE